MKQEVVTYKAVEIREKFREAIDAVLQGKRVLITRYDRTFELKMVEGGDESTR